MSAGGATGGAERPAHRGGRLQALRARLQESAGRLFAQHAVWVVLYFAVLPPLLVVPRLLDRLPLPAPGAPAPADLVAPETVEYVDHALTRSLREGAREAVLPVYDLDRGAGADAADRLAAAFDAWRAARTRIATEPPAGRMARLRQTADLPAGDAVLQLLDAAQFNRDLELRLAGVLRRVLDRHIVATGALAPGQGPWSLRDARGDGESRKEGPGDLLTLDEARAFLGPALREAGLTGERARVLEPFLRELIAPTLQFNAPLTAERRAGAAERIEPIRIRVSKGKVLLRRGEVADGETALRLQAWSAARRAGASGRTVVGNLLLAALLLFFLSRYVFFYQMASRRDRHLFALLVVVMLLSLLTDRGFLWLYDRVVDTVQIEPFSDPAFYRYMMPVATGAMLVTLLVNPRVGMAYVLFYVPLFAMMMDWDLRLMLFCLVSNLAGVYGIGAYRRRTAPIQAGILLGGVNAIAVLALEYVLGKGLPGWHLAFQMTCGFAGGILVAVLASFLLPLLESVFGILTDVRLLELSNLNNPLLRRLAVEAPGSYNHSVIVGTLAEAAAEAVGANALFCRVAACYHDVGKMLKPGYFVENQQDGVNRHDRLSPHMSALVIASHVKEGIELARSYGLPPQVLDVIPQHHGTRRINYFYQKAVEAVGPAAILDSDYRYPGPKPQTRESALLMMADSIEAASRTLDAPSPARFKGMIRTIVSDIVLDEQLSECELSFADLERASAAFLGCLCSVYHHRIDYPGFDFEKTPERPFRGSRTHTDPPTRHRRWGR